MFHSTDFTFQFLTAITDSLSLGCPWKHASVTTMVACLKDLRWKSEGCSLTDFSEAYYIFLTRMMHFCFCFSSYWYLLELLVTSLDIYIWHRNREMARKYCLFFSCQFNLKSQVFPKSTIWSFLLKNWYDEQGLHQTKWGAFSNFLSPSFKQTNTYKS